MVRVDLRPSCLIAAALAAAHSAAALTLVPLGLPLAAKASLALAVAVSLIRSTWRHAFLQGREALTAIEIHADGRACARTRAGEWRDARILGTSYIAPTMTVINVRLADRALARHMILVPDNCEAETFRQLRVRLRWGYRVE